VKKKFMELKTTDNTTVWINKDAVEALEEQQTTARAPGHTKVYLGSYKFLIVDQKPDDIIQKIEHAE